MPRRNIRIVVDLNIHAVTAPGVWLSSREDVYLGVSMFGQYRRTKLLRAMFPLFIHEKLRFEKTFYTALSPSEIVNLLEDEPVVFELVQLSEFSVGGIRLASFATDTQDFLYPYPTLAPSYAPAEREILLNRTVNFPGISPKVEFSSKATIRESVSSEFDALEDAIEEQKAALKALRREVSHSEALTPRRSRSRSRKRYNTYDKHTVSSAVRSRSPSPSFIRRFEDCCLESDRDIKPPFVVKKLDDSLIGRKPGSPATKSFLRGSKSTRRRSRSVPRSRSICVASHSDSGICGVCHRPYRASSCRVCRTYRKHTGKRYWGHTPPYNELAHCPVSPNKVVHEPYSSVSRPVYSSRLVTDDSEDEEVAELLSSAPSYPIRPRPRSVSPVLYRRSFRDRYSDSAFSPRLSERIADRVDSALRRSNSLVKLSREMSRSTSPISSRYYNSYTNGYDSLDELETDFTLAKNRSLVHLDNGHYWTQKAAEYRGISHEDLFQENLRKIYSKLYTGTTSSEV
ncbi:spermatogenesis-associated protein 6-like isoform X2 [Liolophura sinensis]|uniref:spermatogenesis-associated protein 6-like isoform X2 n=1 Tax=Liolophura sinensis TaxID=3198878 RepID=UPI0031584432